MTHKAPTFRSHLANARGLGSAKDGTSHWWWQRVTAIALIPLTIWFVYSLVGQVIGSGRMDVADWISSPAVTIALLLMLSAMFYHAKLGLTVIIEDYVHCHCKKMAAVIFMTLSIFSLTVISWVAILKIHFVGI